MAGVEGDVDGNVGMFCGKEVVLGGVGFDVLSSLPSVLAKVLFLHISVASLSFSAVASFTFLPVTLLFWCSPTSTFPFLTCSLMAGVCTTRPASSPPPPSTPTPKSTPTTAPPTTTRRRRPPPTRRGVRPPPDPPTSPSIGLLSRLLFSS